MTHRMQKKFIDVIIRALGIVIGGIGGVLHKYREEQNHPHSVLCKWGLNSCKKKEEKINKLDGDLKRCWKIKGYLSRGKHREATELLEIIFDQDNESLVSVFPSDSSHLVAINELKFGLKYLKSLQKPHHKKE